MSKTKGFSKVLALVIMLALVMGIMPMGAMASTTPVYVRFFNGATQIGSTVSVTASDDTVYSAITAAIAANSSITSSDVTPYGVNSINGLTPSDDTYDTDSWLYTVDDELGYTAIGQMPVSAGSVVTVFYATNYQTTQYAYIVPDGAATSGNAIAANSGTTIYYRVATSTVDFSNVYSTIGNSTSSLAVTSSTTAVTATPSVSGYTVIPAYKRVVASSSSILSSWRTATTAAYNALTSTQQATINSTVVSNGTSPSATMTQVNNLARYVAPLTRNNSKDLKSLYFTHGGEKMSLWQTTGIGYFDPDVPAYELETATGSVTINAAALASGATISYTSSGTGMSVSSAGVITFSATGTYTLTVKVTNSGTKSYTVSIHYAAAATSGVPDAVCGYLPIGQFARGNGWGAICTDGTNTGTTKKFLSGYVSTGVSLGVLGGYVQFDMGENKYISDDASHPYGIDFIVYGNPFSGNPEAGSVMVSEDGKVWYNLAGSLHFDSNTQRNVDISYLKLDDATTINGVSFAKGIHYSTNYVPTSSTDATVVNAAISAATWTSFVTGTAWWPEYTTESYGGVWNDGHVGDTTDSNITGDVFWNRSGAGEVITYRGVTQVKDDAQMSLSGASATNYYRFGYADVRQAGSSYGTAVNPYATLPAAAAGGDGFDLAWAVDRDGKPVNMSGKHIRFIRVYSAVLFNAGIFGETSAEVCGLYVATGSTSETALTPTVTVAGNTKSTTNGGMTTVSMLGTGSCTITVTPNAGATGTNYVFINGVATSSASFTPSSAGTKVQIIVQNGEAAPYITYLNLKP